MPFTFDTMTIGFLDLQVERFIMLGFPGKPLQFPIFTIFTIKQYICFLVSLR